jgi:hypothetical protein
MRPGDAGRCSSAVPVVGDTIYAVQAGGRRRGVVVTLAVLAIASGACDSPPATIPGSAGILHSAAVSAGGTGYAPLAELTLELYGQGPRLVTVSVPSAAYDPALVAAQAGGPGVAPVANDPRLLLDDNGPAGAGVASWEADCNVANEGAFCQQVLLVPTQAPITIRFNAGDAPWRYPISGSGASCDVSADVYDQNMREGANPKADISLTCSIRVAGAVTVTGHWRSGTGFLCIGKPGNYTPAPWNVWVYQTADFPEQPPPPPVGPGTPDCSAYPPSDPLAKQVGEPGP